MSLIRTALPSTLAALLLVGAAAAHAAPEDAKARYERDRQACLSGNTQQARDVCLREAGAAQDAARANQLRSPAANAKVDNATERCEVFTKAEERAACLVRVQSPAASGSVMQGGVLRESVTTTITTTPAGAAPSK